jgi:BRCT domain type II-containing protein
MDAVASKFKDATKRSVVIVNLQRLQGLLLNHYSLEQINALPTLTPSDFQGTAYQAAGAPLPFNPAATSASATASAPRSAMATAGSAMAAAGSAMAAAASALAAAESAAASKPDPPPSSNAIVTAISTNNESTDVVPHAAKKVKFTIPKPGVNGGVAGVLNGKRFVLTGVFPEVGGGTGLSLGKDRVTSMIESFGGVVTSAVSGKTNFLLVGAEPGRSKVSKADEKGIPLIDLIALNRLLLGQSTLEATASAPPPRIDSFSAGYAGQFRLGY